MTTRSLRFLFFSSPARASVQASITPGSPLFVDFVGALDANAEASPQLTVPNLPFLVGLELYAAAFTVSPVVPAERLLSNWTRLTLVQ